MQRTSLKRSKASHAPQCHIVDEKDRQNDNNCRLLLSRQKKKEMMRTCSNSLFDCLDGLSGSMLPAATTSPVVKIPGRRSAGTAAGNCHPFRHPTDKTFEHAHSEFVWTCSKHLADNANDALKEGCVPHDSSTTERRQRCKCFSIFSNSNWGEECADASSLWMSFLHKKAAKRDKRCS